MNRFDLGKFLSAYGAYLMTEPGTLAQRDAFKVACEYVPAALEHVNAEPGASYEMGVYGWAGNITLIIRNGDGDLEAMQAKERASIEQARAARIEEAGVPS